MCQTEMASPGRVGGGLATRLEMAPRSAPRWFVTQFTNRRHPPRFGRVARFYTGDTIDPLVYKFPFSDNNLQRWHASCFGRDITDLPILGIS